MKRSETKKLDKEWSLRVRTRYKFICQVCKRRAHNNNAAHIIPKHANPILRHDIRNGICLCFRCHKVGPLAFHQNPLWFNKWMRRNKYKQWRWAMIASGITKAKEETNEMHS